MWELELRSPENADKLEVIKYKEEFLLNSDNMDGTAGLKDVCSYEEWISLLHDNSNKETVREGLVPASTFLCIRKSDKRIVGMIDIRHNLNDYLFNFGGHIGYSIRKSERRRGYAKEMLRLGLKECRYLGIKRILITCNKENIPSSKTILANGGILENEVLNENKITQRYWINIEKEK